MQKSITKGTVRSKSHKDQEDLRGRLREVEKENKALRKRLRKLEKSRHVWEQYSLDSDEHAPKDEDQFKVAPTCPSCKHGALLLLDLGIKRLWTCSSCTFRKIDGQS